MNFITIYLGDLRGKLYSEFVCLMAISRPQVTEISKLKIRQLT